jgi:hypothetical protein
MEIFMPLSVKWKKIDNVALEEEWNTEQLDSLFFSGYPSKKQVEEVKEIFFNKIHDFATIEKIDYIDISRQLYGNNPSSLEELKKSTEYMKKDIDFIANAINKGEAVMPLLMRKNGKLEILGGRTRSSVTKLLNKELRGLVIDYDEMTKHFYKLREKNFMGTGYGVFAMEDKKIRFKLLHHLKKGTAESIIDSIPILDGLSKEQKISELNDLREHLFSNDITKFADFQKWIEGSKVVDSKGEPLSVYHGTDKEFQVFDKSKIGKNFLESKGGFFFTEKKSSAKNYAFLSSKGEKGVVMECHINIKNPETAQTNSEYYTPADYFDMHSSELLTEAFVHKKDGIIIYGTKNDNLYVPFEPEQIRIVKINDTPIKQPIKNGDTAIPKMEMPIIKDGKVDEELLKTMSEKYTRPKKTKRGRVDFKAFANTLGNDKVANIRTPLGHTKVLVNSQFWKMLTAKENRQNVLFNIKSTLKNPVFIIEEEDSFKFYSSFKKPNGSLFHMLSICGKDEKDELVLKTSFQIRDLSAVRKLAIERGTMLYCCGNMMIQDCVPDKGYKNQNIENKAFVLGRHDNSVLEDIVSEKKEVSLRDFESIKNSISEKKTKIEDMNKNRIPSNLKYKQLNGEKMFNDRVMFDEVINNKSYFEKQKHGLMAVVVAMPPQDYIEAVELRQPDHKIFGASQEKLDNLKEVYEAGIKVDIPMLAYGYRDSHSDLFSQEGYHRATSALAIGKELIPVAIRYREDDENIPDFIKEHIENSQLEIVDMSMAIENDISMQR